VRLLPSASDPVVGEVVKRVQRKRLDFLAQTFREAGFTPAESASGPGSRTVSPSAGTTSG
jgi:Tfp pilus assembly protein PilW